MSSKSYTANATLTGSIDYTSFNQGTASGTLNGMVTSGTDSGKTFTADFTNGTTHVGTITQTGNVLTGSVAVTAPSDLAGSANLASGSTFDTSQISSTNTTINWAATSGGTTGSWTGTVSPTDQSPFSIALTTPHWDSTAETQIDFGFTVNGMWNPVKASAYSTPVSYVNAWWATGSTANTETTEITTGTGNGVPVYWNQASGTGSIQGISPAGGPNGENYVLIQVGASNNLVPFMLRTGSQIVDNSQPGFWSSASGNWTTINSGLGGTSLVSATANGSEQSQAAWWFSMPAGAYEISIAYTAGSSLTKDMGLDLYDGVGNWIGQIPVNEQVAPNSFTEDGVAWENLGAFQLTSNVFHVSTWNSSADGAICVNGIQLQSVPIIDDANVLDGYTNYPPAASVGSFSTTGSWTTSAQGAFGGSHVSTGAVGSGSSTATWSMPVTPGSYEVDVTWPASASLSASATYNVYDGGTKLGSVAVDQQTAPSGVAYEGVNWLSLGSFTFSTTQLSVTLANSAGDGQVDADAVRILPSYQPTPIVANLNYPGFWNSNSGWTTENTGLYGTSLVSNTPNGVPIAGSNPPDYPSQAAWWFPFQPGNYQVYATWVPGNNLSSTARLDVYNALTYISTSTVNEQNAPVGVSDQGVVWQSLGVFTMTSDVLHISTWNSQTNGAINVDGIRIVPVGA